MWKCSREACRSARGRSFHPQIGFAGASTDIQYYCMRTAGKAKHESSSPFIGGCAGYTDPTRADDGKAAGGNSFASFQARSASGRTGVVRGDRCQPYLGARGVAPARGRGISGSAGQAGLFVSSVTTDEARQVYEVRAALEPEMARLFAERATARISRRWRARFGSWKAGSRNVRAYVSAYDRFMKSFSRAAGTSLRNAFCAPAGPHTFLRTITTRNPRRPTGGKLSSTCARSGGSVARNGEQLAQRCRLVQRSANLPMPCCRRSRGQVARLFRRRARSGCLGEMALKPRQRPSASAAAYCAWCARALVPASRT